MLEGSQPLARRNRGHHRHRTTGHVQALFPGNRGVARIHARHLARMPRASAPAPLAEAPSRSTRAGEARGSAARGGSPAARGGGAATDGHRIQDNSILRAMEIGYC